jgi:hypothetical protein
MPSSQLLVVAVEVVSDRPCRVVEAVTPGYLITLTAAVAAAGQCWHSSLPAPVGAISTYHQQIPPSGSHAQAAAVMVELQQDLLPNDAVTCNQTVSQDVVASVADVHSRRVDTGQLALAMDHLWILLAVTVPAAAGSCIQLAAEDMMRRLTAVVVAEPSMVHTCLELVHRMMVADSVMACSRCVWQLVPDHMDSGTNWSLF